MKAVFCCILLSPASGHVLIVVEENHGCSSVIGSSSMRYKSVDDQSFASWRKSKLLPAGRNSLREPTRIQTRLKPGVASPRCVGLLSFVYLCWYSKVLLVCSHRNASKLVCSLTT